MGWVSGANGGDIFMQKAINNGCSPVGKCPTPELAAATMIYAGATAYDPRTQSTWTSDGSTITNHSLGVCGTVCLGSATLTLGSSSVVSGLAVNDSKSHLYQLETIPGKFAVAVYDIKQPSVANCFNPNNLVSIATGNTPTSGGVAVGIAFDEVQNLVYIAVSEPDGLFFKHHILVAEANKPADVKCSYEVKGWEPGQIASGLTHEAAKGSNLYLTNGKKHLQIAVVDALNCKFTPGASCTATGAMRGLAMVPGWELERFGSSCLSAACATCPGLEMRSFGGDPSIGNPAFGVEIADGPAGSLAGFFVRPDKCSAPVPLMCGAFYAATPISPFILPLAGVGCAGNAKVPLAVPADGALTGLNICMQGIILCPGSGTGMTDAIQFAIAGS